MVSSRTAGSVKWCPEEAIYRHIDPFRQASCENFGRICPVLRPSRPGSRQWHDRSTGDSLRNDAGRQVGIGDDSPIFEMVRKGPRRPRVLERADDTDAPGHQPVRRGPQPPPAIITKDRLERDPITPLTNHARNVLVPCDEKEVVGSRYLAKIRPVLRDLPSLASSYYLLPATCYLCSSLLPAC